MFKTSKIRREGVFANFEPEYPVLFESDPSSAKQWVLMYAGKDSHPFLTVFDLYDYGKNKNLHKHTLVRHPVMNWDQATSVIKRLEPSFDHPCPDECLEYSWGTPATRGTLENLTMGKIALPHLSATEQLALFDVLLSCWKEAYFDATRIPLPFELEIAVHDRRFARSFNAENISDMAFEYRDFYHKAISGGIADLLDDFAETLSAGVPFADVFAI